MTDEIWQDPDSIGDIRRGDVISVMDQGRRITGIADHTNNGAWFTAEHGLLLRPGLPFVFIERGPESWDSMYAVVIATYNAERFTLVRMPEGWWSRDFDGHYELIWKPGDPALNVTDVNVVRPGIPQ